MGWSFEHRDRGTSNLDFFRQQFDPANGYALLDGATVGGTFYGALRQPDGKVTAMVVLTKWIPNDYHNFGTKDMTESWGPVEARCPERILDMLSSTEDLFGETQYETVCDEHRVGCDVQYGPENEGKWRGWDKDHVNQQTQPTGARANADDWRARCREYRAALAKVKPGTRVYLQGRPYEAVDLKRNVFRHEHGYKVRIPWWRSVTPVVVPA